jgi:hypothetical protein
MTSVLRKYSLIDVRAQNMYVLADCSGYTYVTTQNIAAAPVMSKTDFASAYQQTVVFLVADMVKDLGRFIHVYDTANSNNLVQVFRQVMLLQNGTTEGVTTKIAYVCTWSADGLTDAKLARIG